MSKKISTALVVEGGAMRGIFSTGVLDAFIKESFNPFDACVGVSAGSTNIAAYLANMYQRNYRIYTDYSLRPDFISMKNFIFGGHLVDLDWMWKITIKEVRLDLARIMKSRSSFHIGVTDVDTGAALFMQPKKDTLEDIIKASSAIPLFYRGFVPLNGKLYADGGVSDPIPVREAYRLGAKRIMVIRSRPFSKTVESGAGDIFVQWGLRKYPGLRDAVLKRPQVYQESLDFLRNPPRGVTIHEINPPEDFATSRLTKDLDILNRDYQIGVDAGYAAMKLWTKKK